MFSKAISEWECMSMNPGQTTHPEASMVRAASNADASPRMTVTVSPVTPTSARNHVCPVPSMTRPPDISKSNIQVESCLAVQVHFVEQVLAEVAD